MKGDTILATAHGVMADGTPVERNATFTVGSSEVEFKDVPPALWTRLELTILISPYVETTQGDTLHVLGALG